MVGRRILLTLLWASCLVSSTVVATAASAADQPLNAAMRQLADEKPAVRRQAINAIAASKDGRMIDFLKAYSAGNIYFWKSGDRLVFCEKMTNDANGDKQFAALRPVDARAAVGRRQTDRRAEGSTHRHQSQRHAVPPRLRGNHQARALVDRSRGTDGRGPESRQRRQCVLIPSLEEVAADKDASEKIRRMARESRRRDPDSKLRHEAGRSAKCRSRPRPNAQCPR